MQVLSETALAKKLEQLREWRVEARQLVRSYRFPEFRDSISFVNRVAEEAEGRQHHPDMDIRYSRVLLMLTTHDAGGITEKDTDMAAACDRLAADQE